ncbi:hypothetical protein CYLTODRAFT_418130 [Cylindrobasidium torrendii FP15055 ss-10]|uniref:F-box domain-containing protein n=1 Tax=Cylindrobasidium torrendii FP15055 ss-10 TaxID=1314674 RepID=A0A0D7BNL0_9AGAR|nr:hypothetical protein CYLTODRAFT_418130 [Cylindrobasidium torrendii FP15055 ss-10]
MSEGLQPPTQDHNSDEEDEEWINVVTTPNTPARTRPSSPSRGSRPTSPSPQKRSTLRPKPKEKAHDPLRILPTEVNQKIFALISLRDLAKCSLVCRKWFKSQTLNYVWFQHYRKDNFQDQSLPPGKWTKRESKENWRSTHLLSRRTAALESSGYSSPSTLASISNNMVFTSSGYMTPREVKEERWKQEADQSSKGVSKNEMRDMYKELGGRKVRGKGGLGGREVRGNKDRAGFSEDSMWGD